MPAPSRQPSPRKLASRRSIEACHVLSDDHSSVLLSDLTSTTCGHLSIVASIPELDYCCWPLIICTRTRHIRLCVRRITDRAHRDEKLLVMSFGFDSALNTPSAVFNEPESILTAPAETASAASESPPKKHNQKGKKKRQRVSRACDRCNRRRVRCDGNIPCSRCTNVEECQFTRLARKRGKPVRRRSPEANSSGSGDEDDSGREQTYTSSQFGGSQHANVHRSASMSYPTGSRPAHRYSITSQRSDFQRSPPLRAPTSHPDMPSSTEARNGSISLQSVQNFPPTSPNQPFDVASNSDLPLDPSISVSAFPGDGSAYSMFDPNPMAKSDTSNSAWKQQLPADSRYPVLKPLFPYIRSFLTPSQACSLLELYFTSSFKDYMHPVCRHIHAYLFRKSSVLSTSNPRSCSPALLASMLWAAAETGGPDMLSWPHTKRKNVGRKLYVLTIQLLRPLIHVDMGCAHWSDENGEPRSACPSNLPKNMDVSRESFSEQMPFTENQGTLDDVITYIHVAAITSASEHKAASMRWWHAAFSLARELKLNKESVMSATNYMTSGTTQTNEIHMQETEADPWFGLSSFNFDQGLMDFMEAPSEPSPPNAPDKQQQLNAPNDQEYDEERRRTWWLLYIQDRHLALCYNRNLALLDAECADLLLPLDEAVWQSGSFITDTSASANRPVFPNFECTGHNLFGFFLPLMTIVGEILDHNHAKNHPLLGGYYRNTTHGQGIESEISRQLQCYEESLHRFEAVQIPQDQTINFSTHQHALHTKTVVAYATHVTQVLHILLTGKWDPVSLFDNEDHWMSSPSFTMTMGHAIAAADAVSQILEVDPDLSFIPYFLGIQLLQGSFVLLLIIDRLQTKTDPRIINACEVIIRATEACVATLDTEYQVSLLLLGAV
jgi:hypothetical protein